MPGGHLSFVQWLRGSGLPPIALALLGLGLLLRVGWVLVHQVDPVSDFQTYQRLAANVAEHGDYALLSGKPTAFRPPGWPLLLGGVYVVTGVSTQAGALVGAVLSWIATVAGAIIAYRLLRPAFALLATAAVSLYPAGIAYTAVLGTEHLAAALLTTLVALLIARRIGLWRALAVGLLLGALLLTRPEYGLVAAAVVLVEYLLRRDRRRLPAALAVTSIGALALVAPWTARNAARFHEFIPTGTNGGVTFYLGTVDVEFSRPPLVVSKPPEVNDRPKRRENLYWRKGLHNVRQHPLRWLGYDARRLLVQHETEYGTIRWAGPGLLRTVPRYGSYVYWWVLLLLALLGGVALMARRTALATWRPLLAILVGTTLFKTLFIVNGRDRLPLIALFAVAAGYGAQTVYDLLRSRTRSLSAGRY